MHTARLQNLVKSRNQLEQKLVSINQLSRKVKQMDTKMTHRGYQKVNSVMMRNFEVKHTSEFMIKLSDEYFVEVKAHAVGEYLARRAKIYEEELKKVGLRVEVMEQRVKGEDNRVKQEQVIGKNYTKSIVESIGKNEQGEQMFNIIEVQGQQQASEPVQSQKINATTNNIKTSQNKENNTATENSQTQKPSIPQTRNNLSSKSSQSSSGQESEQGGDLLLDRGEYSSGQNSLDQIQQEQNDEDRTPDNNQGQISKKQTQQSSAVSAQKSLTQTQEPVIKSAQVKAQQQQTKPNTKQSKSIKTQNKPQSKPTKQQPQQPPKPISRFKLQRMKQKLQASIQ